MFPFTYTRAASVHEAIEAGGRGGRYIAGGTTLVDLMRETVERPHAVVDIADLPLSDVSATPRGGLRIGALARMADVAAHPVVRLTYPAVAQALELSASAQLRNMATIGGNVMQRTRCAYFRDISAPCNRREPGSGCSALEGYNRTHAILGTSEHCVATHLLGPEGRRATPIGDFLLPPGDTPDREQDLRPGELIVAVEVPPLPRPLRSGYLKVRDRESYEFALTSAAVALHIRGGVIHTAKVAAGGVGTVPWKLPAVEQHLVGRRPSPDLWAQAAERATDGARPLVHNGFKTELLRRTVERQLRIVGGHS
jgi:xanthine dehydrogenase YagS FAD-binding subunit